MTTTFEVTRSQHNRMLLQASAPARTLLAASRASDPAYLAHLEALDGLAQGGFNHGDVSGHYVTNQAHPRYSRTRLCGWHNLFSTALDGVPERRPCVIADYLAGSGTLEQRLRHLFPHLDAVVLGMDVSRHMCEQALKLKHTVFWGSYQHNLFRANSADLAVAAYGLHHVPRGERPGFVRSMRQTLTDDGVCVLHDFATGSASARWYSDAIHQWRPVGHACEHFTMAGMRSLLAPHFAEVEVRQVYDPFVLDSLPEQGAAQLKRDFFAYLVELFSLTKLLPPGVSLDRLRGHPDPKFWQGLEWLLTPYFTLSEAEVAACEATSTDTVPVHRCLELTQEGDRWRLIAPRAALVGMGRSPKVLHGR